MALRSIDFSREDKLAAVHAWLVSQAEEMAPHREQLEVRF
jgi:hypothetical protein